MPHTVAQKTIKLGIVGFGTVGAGVCKLLSDQETLLSGRSGDTFEVVKVAVRDLNKPRAFDLPDETFTTHWEDVVNHPEVDIVVELMGGTSIAFDVVSSALELKKPVITGNKALLAERGKEVFALSSKNSTPIYFEAAVAGGIPIIKTIRESFVGNSVQQISGIINGTCNFILERMSEGGLSYEAALKEAMDLGYAEADPTLDVNGWDAGHKAILLAAVSYGFLPQPEETFVSGIENVRLADIRLANELGYATKLLSIVKPTNSGVEIRTQPSLIPKTHLLANVNGVFNALSVKGDPVGDAFIYGRGAGEGPTATAVVADIIDAASTLNSKDRGFLPYSKESMKVVSIGDTETAYFVSLSVKDESGVMAQITIIFSDEGISFSGTHSNVNPETPDAAMNQVAFVTHIAPFAKLNNAVEKLKELDCVTVTPSVYRIELLG